MKLCPNCKRTMEWVNLGKKKKPDGTVVKLGYWRCPNPNCGAFRDSHWTGRGR